MILFHFYRELLVALMYPNPKLQSVPTTITPQTITSPFKPAYVHMMTVVLVNDVLFAEEYLGHLKVNDIRTFKS